MISMDQLLASLISRNPQIASNPRSKAMLDLITSGDKANGEELADNLCRTYGVTRDEALAQAKQFFGIK